MVPCLTFNYFRLTATTLVVAKMCKMQKVLNFAHFNPKNIHINLCKNVQIYTMALQMNNNRAYMHGYCSCVTDFFILFFLSPLSSYFSSPTFTTTQRGKIRRRKKKITTQPPIQRHHQTPQPST